MGRTKKKKKVQADVILPIFEEPEYKGHYPGVTMVESTLEGCQQAFAEIDQFQKIKRSQDAYTLFVSFAGQNISRKGFLSLIAITTGEGKMWIFDVLLLEDILWDNGMREFLEICYNEKVIWDGREAKDLLEHKHGIQLKGIFDMKIVEVYERGKVKTYEPLPHVEVTKDGMKKSVVQKDNLFTKAEAILYYAKSPGDLTTICKKVSEKDWRSRKKGVENSAMKWIVEHQKFLVTMWKCYDWSDTRKLLYWWVSSELYCSMFSDKEHRTYDKYENNDYLPQFILCYINTDQPLGGVRCTMCMRMLPSYEFTHPMLLDRMIATCTLCVKVGGTGTQKTVKPPKNKKKKKKKKPKKKVKKEGEEGEEGEEDEEDSEEGSEEEEEEEEEELKEEDAEKAE